MSSKETIENNFSSEIFKRENNFKNIVNSTLSVTKSNKVKKQQSSLILNDHGRCQAPCLCSGRK